MTFKTLSIVAAAAIVGAIVAAPAYAQRGNNNAAPAGPAPRGRPRARRSRERGADERGAITRDKLHPQFRHSQFFAQRQY